jgi:hypothetical protein
MSLLMELEKLFEKPRRGDNIIAWGDAPGLEA